MAMEAMLKLTKNWADADMVDMTVYACDGNGALSTNIYIGHAQLRDAAAALKGFNGTLFDLEFGKFGPEYAAGAMLARLHLRPRGLVVITIRLQSPFASYGNTQVASEATLYLVTELGMLDEFSRAVQAISNGQCEEAQLWARPLLPEGM